MFVSWVALLWGLFCLKGDFSESVVSHHSMDCFSASPGTSLPGMEDHISQQSAPLPQ